MKRIFFLLLTLFLLLGFGTGCASVNQKFDRADRVLFTAMTTAQIADGLTTVDGLAKGARISHRWAWKYGTDRPSALRMWTVKTVELGGAYWVAQNLSDESIRALGIELFSPREIFLGGTTALLISCAANNINKGYQFRITY